MYWNPHIHWSDWIYDRHADWGFTAELLCVSSGLTQKITTLESCSWANAASLRAKLHFAPLPQSVCMFEAALVKQGCSLRIVPRRETCYFLSVCNYSHGVCFTWAADLWEETGSHYRCESDINPWVLKTLSFKTQLWNNSDIVTEELCRTTLHYLAQY